MIGSKNDKVQTPVWLYDLLHKEFSFDFDPCPLEMPEWNGLERDWGERNFVNPPYSNIRAWLKKGISEFEKGKLSVFLITMRPNTRYWTDFVWPYVSEIRIPDGTLQFEGYVRGFPCPVCVLIFDPARKKLKIRKALWSGRKKHSVHILG